MGSEQYCLKWNNHWANLVRVFNSLRLSETFVDVTIACEGRHLKAHRLILSACSPYFKELLVSHPDKHPIIILKDVRYTELEHLIQFIYNGEVSVEQQDLPSLLCTARELQIKGLAEDCVSSEAMLSTATTAVFKASEPPPLPPPPQQPPPPPPPPPRSLKDSTNTSSILLPTKPKDQPTYVNVNANATTTTTTSVTTTACTTTPCNSSGSGSENGVASTAATVAAAAPWVLTKEEPSLKKSPNHSSIEDLTIIKEDPDMASSPCLSSSRERSSPPPPPPLPKRRKLSRNSAEESYASSSISSLSDEVVKLKVPPPAAEEGSPSLASPQPPQSLVHKSNQGEEENGKEDRSEEKENKKPEVELVKEPKDKPPDTSNKTNVSEDASSFVDEEPMSIQPPEVILEEDDSGVVTTNGTTSPSLHMPPLPPTPSSCENSLKEVPKPSVPSTVVSPQISFLQQALAMGYPQPLHFLQSNLMDQQQTPQQKQQQQQQQQQQQHQQQQPQQQSPLPTQQQSLKFSVSGNQNLTPPGLVQAKNIFNFVDLLKAMGAAIPPGAQSGMVPSANGSSQNSGHRLSPLQTQASDMDKNPLTCHICARIMPSQQVLEEHIRIHEEEKPYKCEQCGQRYKYQSAFQRHQEQNHTAKLPGDKPYRCDVCGQCFKYHKSFTKHRANHDLLDSFMKTEPVEAGAGGGAQGGGAIRALQESYLQRLLHPSFASPTADALRTVIKEEVKDSSEDETKGAKSPCLVSSTSLPGGSFGSENGDIKEEEDDDIDIDDEIVPDVPGDGEEELEEPSSEKFYFCIQCKLTFRDSKSFEGHCRLSPGCSSDTLKEVAVGGDISLTSVPSSVGPSPQGSPQPSQSGGQSGAGTSTAVSQPNSSSLVFSSPPAMLYTLVSGLPQTSSCLPSSSVTPTILNLSKLVNLSHVPNILRGGSSDNLTLNFGNSMTGFHGGVNNLLGGMEEERPFKCPYCQKGFKGRENLKLHIRTHTGEKPYNCGVCGKAFGGRSDMNRHLRIHTGEKPYPCKVCGKKFARADYLSKHITTHLGIPFAKPVHSLQQSLQNLENMQNLQNLENMQNLQSLPSNLQSMQTLQASVANLQPTLPAVPAIQTFQGLQSIPNFNLQSFPNLQTMPSVQNLGNLQSVQSASPTTTPTASKDEIPNFTK